MTLKSVNKIVSNCDEAVAGFRDGHSVMISGFGAPGLPFQLIEAVLRTKARNLTLICNNPTAGFPTGLADLLRARVVSKIICSYPRTVGMPEIREIYEGGGTEIEVVPQGVLSERIRAGRAGLGGFFTRTAAATPLSKGKETRVIENELYVFEKPLRSDFALIACRGADRWGNLVYSATGRSFGAVMAGAATVTVAQAKQVLESDWLDPERIVTPGIFVQRVVQGGA